MNDTTNIDKFDLDLLDVSIDDIEDLPSFDCPPDGTYQFLLSASLKVFDGKDGKADSQAVSFDYEITEVIQMASLEDKPPTIGSKFNELFGLSSEDGIKYLKKAILPYSQHFSTSNMKELVTEKVQNVVLTGTMKARVAKKDKDGNKLPAEDWKRYPQVINVVIA